MQPEPIVADYAPPVAGKPTGQVCLRNVPISAPLTEHKQICMSFIVFWQDLVCLYRGEVQLLRHWKAKRHASFQWGALQWGLYRSWEVQSISREVGHEDGLQELSTIALSNGSSLFESNLHSIWESCMSAPKYFNLSISFHIFPMSHLSPTHTHQCSSRPRSCLTYLDLMHPGTRKQGSGNTPLPSVAPNFRSTIRWPVRKSTLKKKHPAPPPHVLAPFWFWIYLKRRTSSRAAASCTMPFWSMELSKLQIQHFTP